METGLEDLSVFTLPLKISVSTHVGLEPEYMNQILVFTCLPVASLYFAFAGKHVGVNKEKSPQLRAFF